jgi:lipopolysaccharide export system protein LptC
MTFSSRVRYWLPLLPLLGLLAATYWLNQQVKIEPAKPEDKKRHDPDAIVENFSATKLNELGVPDFTMAARRMLHYPNDDSTTLEDPRITLMYDEHPTIHATAKLGNVSSKGDEVFLQDEVKVIREANASQNQLTLQTEYLHIIPEQNVADTSRAVTITDAHSTVRATGMEMDNKARTLKLLSQVRSEHVPHEK